MFKSTLNLFIKHKTLCISSGILYLIIMGFLIISAATTTYMTFAQTFMQFAPVYFIAFLFISYEFFYLSRNSSCDECINATYGGEKGVYRYQSAILLILSTIFCLSFFVCHIVCCLSGGIHETEVFLHIALCIFLNFFLLSVIAVLFSYITAKFFKRLSAYLLMILFVFITIAIFKPLFVNTSLYPLADFFDLYLYLGFMPNHSFGFSLLPYRWAKILFWIFLLSVIIFLFERNYDKRSSYLKAGICAIFCFVSVIVYCQPVSKVDMSEHYQLQEMTYYQEHPQKEQKANFKIKSYDMKLNIRQILKADVTIEIESQPLDEYIFTLYHGYNIQTITERNGNELLFEQDGDYLIIKNPQMKKLDEINIKYNGFNSTFYSNMQGIYLSGAFPYYPKAGFNRMYTIDTQSYIPVLDDGNVKFTVSFSGNSDKIFSNLEKLSDGTFSGQSNGASIVKGFYRCVKFGDTELIYPYLAQLLMSEETAEKEINNLYESPVYNSQFDKIISTPNMNTHSFYPIYNNYMELIGIIGIREKYDSNFIDKNKQEFYNSFFTYKANKDNLNSLLLSEDEEYAVSGGERIISKMKNVIEIYGEERACKEIETYLFDNSDKRSPSTFLNNLIEKGNKDAENR